jgi:hypothetical protein
MNGFNWVNISNILFIKGTRFTTISVIFDDSCGTDMVEYGRRNTIIICSLESSGM